MNLKFKNKKISGILTVIPEDTIKFDDEIENYGFTRGQSMKLKLVMGYNQRRVTKKGTTVSDLCVYGMNYLFEKGLLKKDEIDAMILVTQSPDYFMPATSYVVHGRLGLKQDMICLDINQGCSGYIIGLTQAFMLLEQEEINKVVLLNGDILSTKVSKGDRSSGPLTGDGASITIIESTQESDEVIHGSLKTDGADADVLIIPAGGFKMPSTPETAVLREDKSGNLKALDHLEMKGDAVYNFVVKEVPPLVANLMERASTNKEEIDYFMMHQPNKFMLKQLAKQMEIPEEKMPNNVVENFGNANSVTIPTAITFNLGERLLKESFHICLAGFGVGLSWASFIMKLEKFDFCEMIDFK